MANEKIEVQDGQMFWTCFKDMDHRNSAWDGEAELTEPWVGLVFKEQRPGGMHHELRVKMSHGSDYGSWCRHVRFEPFPDSMSSLLFATEAEAARAYTAGLAEEAAGLRSDAEYVLGQARHYIEAHPEFFPEE